MFWRLHSFNVYLSFFVDLLNDKYIDNKITS